MRAGLRADENDRPTPVRTVRRTATEATTTTAPAATVREPRTYIVQSGDTLDSIALEFDTTLEQLVALNPDVEPTALSVGQRLRVPAPPR